eukprot:scaffold97655_cov52-Attheya_sp.AAC.2
MMIVRSVISLLLPIVVVAFVPSSRLNHVQFGGTVTGEKRVGALFESQREKDIVEEASQTKGKGPALDSSVRSKLLAESIAPWRTVRLFAYGSLGSGAAVGGLITLTGVAAALSGARTDLDLNTEYLNLAIDFGAALAFAVFAKLDLDKGAELSEKVDDKMARKKEQKTIANEMKEREKGLSKLNLDICVAADGATQTAQVGAIQTGGKQHIIIVAGPRKACRDALMGANILKLDFSMSNILVVPYDTSATKEDKVLKPSGGFGDKPVWESQPYVAQATGDGWEEYIDAEMTDAVKQGGEKVKDEGIAIVLANNGKVIRRGVGMIPWRKMADELEAATNPKEEEVIPLFS